MKGGVRRWAAEHEDIDDDAPLFGSPQRGTGQLILHARDRHAP